MCDDTTVIATVPLLKTCRTCFKAKIRCLRTQKSGSCDRCLRLSKTCAFAPARRRFEHTTAKNDEESTGSRSSAEGTTAGLHDANGNATAGPSLTLPLASTVESFDPIARALLDLERAERLLNLFRSRMVSRFPFVVVGDTVTLQELRRERPCLCLAILAAAAFEDFILQRKLGRLFNQLIAAKMVKGEMLSLDVLYGLLVSLAWAHYQPRPRSYSQHLHLATSIVSDLRLDQPRRLQLWKVDFNEGRQDSEWTSDELRALVGTYYLASSSSVILQKMNPFRYTPFILESSEKLEQTGEHPTDKYLRHIVQIQRLAVDFDNATTRGASKVSVDEVTAKIARIQDQINSFKSSLTFALGECPTLLLQLRMLELVICQQSLLGLPFPLASSTTIQPPPESSSQTVEALSASISESKSVINILLAMAPGQDSLLSNIEWIILSCVLSFSVRLDVLAAGPRLAHLTRPLRKRLDIRHSLRQVVLRLQSIASPAVDDRGDRDTFYGFLRRAQAIEAWYLRQIEHSPLSNPTGLDVTPVQIDATAHESGDVDSTADVVTSTSNSDPSASGLAELTDLSFMSFDADAMQDVEFGLYLYPASSDLF